MQGGRRGVAGWIPMLPPQKSAKSWLLDSSVSGTRNCRHTQCNLPQSRNLGKLGRIGPASPSAVSENRDFTEPFWCAPYNQRMPAFLQHHIHWLWVCLHWVHHDIYAPWTFCVFVFIGLAQTAIGLESGELAVKALPLDACTPKQKRRYLRLVRVLASLLFPATVFIGVVNDRSQRDADAKAAIALTNEGITQAKLDESNKRARLSDEAFQAFARSLDPSKLTVAQFAKYTQAQRASAQVASTPSDTTPQQGSSPPPQIFEPAPTNPQKPPIAPTKASVRNEIEQTQAKLNAISVNTSESMRMTLSGVRGLYIMRGSSSPEARDSAFRGTLPQVSAVLKSRDDQFERLVPEIEKERAEALSLLNPSPTDANTDKTAFDKAMVNSTQKVPLPKSWMDGGYLYTLGYGDMNGYLGALAQRLLESR